MAVSVVPLVDGGVGNSAYPVVDFADGHLRARCPSRRRRCFAPWLGWQVAPSAPLMVVRHADQDPAAFPWQAREVHHDQVVGELAGGITAWTGASGPQDWVESPGKSLEMTT